MHSLEFSINVTKGENGEAFHVDPNPIGTFRILVTCDCVEEDGQSSKVKLPTS